MSAILDKAEMTEMVINEKLGGDFALKRALFFAINETDEGVVLTQAGEHGDIYELIDNNDSRQVAKVSDYIAVVTCGWAAPIISNQSDDEVAPSQHPDRRRVRLVVFASKDGCASVMRFSDTPDETMTDDGQAVGSLADAVMGLF